MPPDQKYEEFINALNRLGLNEDPFSLSANPRFVHLGGQHRNVYYLAKSIMVRRQGLGLITGGVGIGKSSLARLLYNEYFEEEGTIITYIPSANWRTRTMAAKQVATALAELEIETKRSYDATVVEISRAISRAHLDHQMNIVLLIDESHLMHPEALELIHELYNFDFDVKAVQVLMFGQPELTPLIAGAEHLASRVVKSLSLDPLSFPEALEMINHRLSIAGRTTPLVEDDAFLTLYDDSNGIPRNIVALCSIALDLLMAEKKSTIDLPLVQAAIGLRSHLHPRGAA